LKFKPELPGWNHLFFSNRPYIRDSSVGEFAERVKKDENEEK